MFLIIFEDGVVKRADTIGDDDKAMSDDGYLDILDISDPLQPLRYASSKWKLIEDIDD